MLRLWLATESDAVDGKVLADQGCEVEDVPACRIGVRVNVGWASF